MAPQASPGYPPAVPHPHAASHAVLAAPARTLSSEETQRVLACVALAFQHATCREVLTPDKLQPMVLAQLALMTARPGELNLEPLWERLQKAPGVKPGDVDAPLLALHAWQDRMHFKVRLPSYLLPLSAMGLGHNFKVPALDLEGALRGFLPDTPVAPHRARAPTTTVRRRSKAAGVLTTKMLTLLTALGAVVVLALFAH